MPIHFTMVTLGLLVDTPFITAISMRVQVTKPSSSKTPVYLREASVNSLLLCSSPSVQYGTRGLIWRSSYNALPLLYRSSQCLLFEEVTFSTACRCQIAVVKGSSLLRPDSARPSHKISLTLVRNSSCPGSSLEFLSQCMW